MRPAVLYEGQRFKIERWGGGLSYCLTDKAAARDVFAQGDSADTFGVDLEAIEIHFPNWSPDQIGAWMWDQLEYGSIAQPIAA